MVNKTQNRYFTSVIFQGWDDELGNMNAIVASSQEEFEEKLKIMFGEQGLHDIKALPDDKYFMFYEASSEDEMNKITKMSEKWEDDELETIYLTSIAEKAKPFSEIKF